MKYANHHRHQGVERRRSSRMDLNPYMIEDLAITLGELERARQIFPMVRVSRESWSR